MLKIKAAFSGFSVNDLAKAKDFYTGTLGLLLDDEHMGLRLRLPEGGTVFVYEKPNHEPSTYTMLNFIVNNIDEAAKELADQGVALERYPGFAQDEQGIMRHSPSQPGPSIAWFKDPAGNILSIIEDKKN